MLVAIALVFMIMVGTFRSLVQPLILMVSIPFAATGAVAGLLITDTPLGVPAMVGLLMLIGIVVTNAIVLIDLINQYRTRGEDLRSAITDGARLRLRPIIMTASATIFALIPMALGFTGGGAFISGPLAIVVIGGLISSTVLTLLLGAGVVLPGRAAQRTPPAPRGVRSAVSRSRCALSLSKGTEPSTCWPPVGNARARSLHSRCTCCRGCWVLDWPVDFRAGPAGHWCGGLAFSMAWSAASLGWGLPRAPQLRYRQIFSRFAVMPASSVSA